MPKRHGCLTVAAALIFAIQTQAALSKVNKTKTGSSESAVTREHLKEVTSPTGTQRMRRIQHYHDELLTGRKGKKKQN
jgi:hypothetical protein